MVYFLLYFVGLSLPPISCVVYHLSSYSCRHPSRVFVWCHVGLSFSFSRRDRLLDRWLFQSFLPFSSFKSPSYESSRCIYLDSESILNWPLSHTYEMQSNLYCLSYLIKVPCEYMRAIKKLVKDVTGQWVREQMLDLRV